MATVPEALPERIGRFVSDHEAGWRNQELIRTTWYDKERLLVGRLADQYSRKTARSHVTDAHLSTLAWERQMRVCSQLPSGQAYSVSKKDEKAAALENLILSKYIIPNANSQFDLLTKLRMTGVYASTYGAQFVLYDYRIDDDYIGPDFWLIPARNITFQPGRNNVQDCAWVDISTVQNKNYIDNLIKSKPASWDLKALKVLSDAVKDGATPSRDTDYQKRTAVEESRTTGSNQSSSTARVELITRYEKGKSGHWVTWAADYPQAGILRDIPNPHKSGKIPIVGRYCFPLLDSVWGLGDFERGMSMQKAKDSLINLYLEAVKMSIFPPLKIDLDNVTISTIRMEAGARWLMKDMNAVQAHEASPMGVQEFTQTYEFMTTALQNQFGTTDTSTNGSQAGNPAFGRTPEAIQKLNQKESARDAWDRYMLETFIQELYEGMINLLGEKQEKPINFHLFDKDLEDIESQFSDEDCKKLLTKWDNRSAKITIPKSLVGGAYEFVIDPSSSKESDEQAQQESLEKILGVYMPNMQVWDQILTANSQKFNAAEALKQYIFNSGVSDPDEILESTEDDGDGSDDESNPQDQAQDAMQQPQPQPQAPMQPQQPQQPPMPQQPVVQPPMMPQQPSTADQTGQILQSVQAGADPSQVMDHLSQASNIRDPQAMAVASQILPGGNR
jgi:hypothetical protein